MIICPTFRVGGVAVLFIWRLNDDIGVCEPLFADFLVRRLVFPIGRQQNGDALDASAVPSSEVKAFRGLFQNVFEVVDDGGVFLDVFVDSHQQAVSIVGEGRLTSGFSGGVEGQETSENE